MSLSRMPGRVAAASETMRSNHGPRKHVGQARAARTRPSRGKKRVSWMSAPLMAPALERVDGGRPGRAPRSAVPRSAPDRLLRLFPSTTPLHSSLRPFFSYSEGPRGVAEGKGRSRRGPAGRAPRRRGGAPLGVAAISAGRLPDGPFPLIVRAGRDHGGAHGTPGTNPGGSVPESATKASHDRISREKKRGISTILFRRSGAIRAFATDLDNLRRRGLRERHRRTNLCYHDRTPRHRPGPRPDPHRTGRFDPAFGQGGAPAESMTR